MFLRLHILVVLVFALWTNLSACTIFTKHENGKVLFGSVENNPLHFAEQTTINFVPPLGDRYGYFSFFYNGNIAGGMNEKGVCFDIAATPYHACNWGNRLPVDFISKILQECASVDEAIAVLNNKYWPALVELHIMIGDSTGRSVVIEWHEDSIHIYEPDDNYQIITNYLIANPDYSYGPWPCPREAKVKAVLESGEVNHHTFTNIIKSVEFAGTGAIYSNIYDPVNKTVTIYYKNNYGTPLVFDLDDELMGTTKSFNLSDYYTSTNVEAEISEPDDFYLLQNYPNPFNPETTIEFALQSEADVSLNVYSLSGEKVAVLVETRKKPGRYKVKFNATGLSSGVYFYQLISGNYRKTKKLVLLR